MEVTALKNTINEMTSILEKFNSRLNEAEGQIREVDKKWNLHKEIGKRKKLQKQST